MAVEALVIVLLLVSNGLFAMAEIAIVSARRARLQEMSEKGSRGARVALELAENPTEFLATIQIGISLVAIISGAYGGVTIGERLAEVLSEVPAVSSHAEVLGVGIVVVTITYLSLVIGELTPKRVALSHPERIAVRVAPSMAGLSKIAGPIVWLLTVSTNGVLRFLHVRPSEEPPISDEELRLLIREGTVAGVFERSEEEMIERLLRLDDGPLASVMTPRHRVTWLAADENEEALLQTVIGSAHARFPVCSDGIEQVMGVLEARRLLAARAQNQSVELRNLLEPALFLPENISVLDAMEELKDEGAELAIVVDEYGGVQGIVTLNDILRALIGSQTSEIERATVRARAGGGYFVDGWLSIEKFREYFGVPDEDEVLPYHTVAGLVLSQLGDIPDIGDVFEWEGLRFEVLDMDVRRVDKIMVTRLPDEKPQVQ